MISDSTRIDIRSSIMPFHLELYSSYIPNRFINHSAQTNSTTQTSKSEDSSVSTCNSRKRSKENQVIENNEYQHSESKKAKIRNATTLLQFMGEILRITKQEAEANRKFRADVYSFMETFRKEKL